MKTEDLPIYRDCQLLCFLLHQYIRQVSKMVRHTTYKDAMDKAFQVHDLIRAANSAREDRVRIIGDILFNLGGVHSRIRLLGETKFLTVRQSINIMSVIDRISKQAAGWRSSAIRKSESHEAKSNMGEQTSMA